MRAPEPLRVVRIVATPESLDRVEWPEGAAVCRIASDELLLLDHDQIPASIRIDDPHAIIRSDTGWVGVTMGVADARMWLSRTADWPPPERCPACVQGLAAGLPVKMWWTPESVRVFVPAPYAAEFSERLP